MRKTFIPAFVAAFGLLAVTAVAAPEHKNLQILPKNITADELKKTMDGFAEQLGV